MAQQDELLRGKPDHHIRPWGYQSVKRHAFQGLVKGQSRLAFQHHVCGPLEQNEQIDHFFYFQKYIFYIYNYIYCFISFSLRTSPFFLLTSSAVREMVIRYYNLTQRKFSLPTGPYKLAITPQGNATDWYFKLWTLLWPLYTILWFSCGLQMGLTVPYMKSKQFGKALPFLRIASAYVWSRGGLIKVWFHAVKWWWCRL